MVKNIWEQDVHEPDSAKTIAAKFKRLRKDLKLWSRNLSGLKQIISDTNFLILFYDTIEEYMELSIEEHNGRRILIAHLEKILAHQRIYWKQGVPSA